MTYCLGILLEKGLVLASDSRSNAGVDQVVRVSKLAVLSALPDRVIALLSAGNLATSQAVVTSLGEAFGHGDPARDLKLCKSLFEAARVVGAQLRETMASDAKFVESYGSADASFLLAGQIQGEDPRLFQIYSAGNFVEASPRSPFLQIGETKYGKPILDRALSPSDSLDEAAKLALLSFDASIRSNLSVGLPIDMLIYRKDSFNMGHVVEVDEDDPYWAALRRDYAEGLQALVNGLPPAPAGWMA